MHGGNRPQQIIYIVQRRQIGGDPVGFPGVTKGERAPGRTLLNLLCEIVNCVGTAHRRMGAVNRITVLIRELLSLIRAVGHEAAADIPLQRIDADHIICIQHRHRLRLQLVKTAQSKSTESTRPRSSPWELTSMAQASMP